jgi:hypothetical protein
MFIVRGRLYTETRVVVGPILCHVLILLLLPLSVLLLRLLIILRMFHRPLGVQTLEGNAVRAVF